MAGVFAVRTAGLAILALLALVASACGGESSGTEPGPTPETMGLVDAIATAAPQVEPLVDEAIQLGYLTPENRNMLRSPIGRVRPPGDLMGKVEAKSGDKLTVRTFVGMLDADDFNSFFVGGNPVEVEITPQTIVERGLFGVPVALDDLHLRELVLFTVQGDGTVLRVTGFGVIVP